MKKFRLLLVAFIAFVSSFAQTSVVDSAAMQRKMMFQKLESRMVYPAVQGSYMTGAIQVDSITEPIDKNTSYKILFDFTQGNPAAYKKGMVNEGLEEIARMINLHRAAGVPAKNLHVTVVVHSAAVMSMLQNASYQEKFQINNPHTFLIKQMQAAGVHFVVCGQTMALRGLHNSDLMPGVKKAFSARTALTAYHAKGFSVFTIADSK